jgi:hypothetical protein
VFDLKPLTKDGVPGAFAKAERYRLLNEPTAAESIFLDIVELEPDNQEALVGLLLSITDQFDHDMADGVRRAREILPRLSDEYQRAYYAGIICERRAVAQLRQAAPGSGAIAYQWLAEARGFYEQAEAIRPHGNDDVLLRWNACARLIKRYPSLRPPSDERYEPYQD